MERIQLTRTYKGELYANVNGVARGSVGCCFDESGALISHTLYGDKLLPKLLAAIEACGLAFPDDVEPGFCARCMALDDACKCYDVTNLTDSDDEEGE
jgi:hypothetical protein